MFYFYHSAGASHFLKFFFILSLVLSFGGEKKSAAEHAIPGKNRAFFRFAV
jgi:hypothetical protein